MDTTAIFPLVLFIATAGIWFALWWQGHRLFYLFRDQYPDIASAEIPLAFSRVAHPSKFFFFLSRRATDLLRTDPPLFALLQRVRRLSILALLVPFAGFPILSGFALVCVLLGKK